jgi:hypothetical protein
MGLSHLQKEWHPQLTRELDSFLRGMKLVMLGAEIAIAIQSKFSNHHVNGCSRNVFMSLSLLFSLFQVLATY